MAGGTYAALSGLRTRMEQLDRLASDIANAKTAGYKAERVTLNAAERPDFGRALQSAIDVAPGPGHLDFLHILSSELDGRAITELGRR